MINVYLLGASGSIGTSVIDCLRANKNKYSLRSISVGHNIERAREIIKEFNVRYVSVINEDDCKKLQKEFPEITVEYGSESLVRCATYEPNKKGKLINAVVGYYGLVPTVEAIKIKRDILLANKETLVCAGNIIKKLVKENDVLLLPIDSEHSAIFQALASGRKEEVSKLIITASGGSFRELSRDELKNVTLEDALKHPSWSMGSKITIDSATMVNKGLEVIEAHYLFDIDYENIETIIHQESIIHSLVEFRDHSVIAQMAVSDMRIPIQYALSYPERLSFNLSESLNLKKIKTLNFKEMDYKRFPMLTLAYKVGKLGGMMPVVYNISNEVANQLFRERKISFLDIEKIITEACDDYQKVYTHKEYTINEIIEAISTIKEELIRKYN